MRRMTLSDRWISGVDQALRTCVGEACGARPNPAAQIQDEAMDDEERHHAAGLMRINHVGEVCAQALYSGQAATARDAATGEQMLEAAAEEIDHLAWCGDRLGELGSQPSLLNPLWYAGSFAIGAIAGLAGDRWSLGFVTETERQVEAHLEGHLEDLPAGDRRSRAIVTVMAEDEARHAEHARAAGGADLPAPIPDLMRLTARVMKWAAYRI